METGCCSSAVSSWHALRPPPTEATTAFGLSPSLIIHDELGRVRGPRSPLYEVLGTAAGAQEAPLSIIISTQAANDSDVLSILIDDALRGDDPSTVIRLFAAPPDLDPLLDRGDRGRKPGTLNSFMNKREVLAMAADAKRMPRRANEFRNLILNPLYRKTSSPFVDPAACHAVERRAARVLKVFSVFGGLDLSESGDLTALVLGHVDVDGVWNIKAHFWLLGDRLAEKAASRDHAPA